MVTVVSPDSLWNERDLVQSIRVELSDRAYPILIGSRLCVDETARQAISETVGGRHCLLISDDHVAPLYAGDLRSALRSAGAREVCETTFPAGEASKTPAVLEKLWRFGVAAGLGRDAVAVALGGGVVGDIAGFFAATYMRGIRFMQVPTSLLADVDSSVGGKVAVDLPEGKNLVGAFHQPSLVLADLVCLRTLPPRELSCGLAEVVKYGVIMDREFFSFLAERGSALRTCDEVLFEEIVSRSCRCKARIVEQDEKEAGVRAVLNYGHTFGHAIEAQMGFAGLNHGECVAIGMGMAADLGARLGMCSEELARRQDRVLHACGLPTSLPSGSTLTAEGVLAAMSRDKKVKGGRLRLVLPIEIGRVEIRTVEQRALMLDAIGGRLG